ncbi:unnamed protein product [Aphanomyces euteiches]|nr:hypothetical protein Ae201684P_009819 [Aphanomyces euteiches]
MATSDSVKLNSSEIQSSFISYALLELNTAVMEIKSALDKVQKKLAVANLDSDSDEEVDEPRIALQREEAKSSGTKLYALTSEEIALIQSARMRSQLDASFTHVASSHDGSMKSVESGEASGRDANSPSFSKHDHNGEKDN